MVDKNRETLSKARRIVVKIGTSTITHRGGKLDLARLERLVREIADLHHQGREVLLVTSGAVGAGIGRLGRRPPRTILEKQALAAVGQGALMHIYEKLFAEYGIIVAQVLLTRDDVEDRRRYLNSRNAILKLLEWRVVPIINENDTVAVEEIRFGDNDTLSALVAALADAQLLIMVSDIDGLYTGDPRHDPGARLVSTVTEITPEVEQWARGAGTGLGTGGMVTKLLAARVAMNSGVFVVVANGERRGFIAEIMEGKEVGTVFVPRDYKLRHRARWIAYGNTTAGQIVVDDGARHAILRQGKSLLPAGIVEVRGEFDVGNVVSVVDLAGRELARGIVNYPSEDLVKLRGRQTAEIDAILGYRYQDEVIHRDNLVVTGDQ